MKQITVLSIALGLGISCCFAQQSKVEHSFSLAHIRVVVLNLTGNTTLQTRTDNDLKIKSYLFKKGDIWGWQFPASRPEFKSEERISHDTAYISTPARYNPAVIGINTYSETIENNLQLPSDVKVIIKKAEQLVVESAWSLLDVKNTDKLTLDIHKSGVDNIVCSAANSLKINGKESPKEFGLYGTGSGTYRLQANKIALNLK